MATAKQKRFFSWTAIAVMVVVFVTVNILANALLSANRIDLTEGSLYTLSEGTKEVISHLKEPVTLRFFYSEEQANGYPAIQSYGTRLKGLLKQYQDISGGKVKVEFINPKVFSEEEDKAVSLGVADITVDGSGNKLYFGLAASNTLGNHTTIPFFDPDKAAFVEYELTRMIHDLSSPKKTKIGLMTWLPLQGGGGTMFDVQGPWVIFQQMKESFDLQVLDTDAQRIPRDIDVLMMVHPAKDIPKDTLYAIDQFILKGGRALIFVDPYTKMDSTTAPSSNLPELFAAWGVEMPEGEVVADPQSAIRVRNEERGSVLESVSNPVWLQLQKGNFNASELISANLEVMRFIASGHLQPKAAQAGEQPSQITMTPLVLSGPAAAIVENQNLMFNFDPAQFMREAKPMQSRAIMAARLSGVAKTAFPGHDDSGHLEQSEDPINVVVIADVDMLRDGFWVNKQDFGGREILVPTANNGGFVFNALDILSGGGELIGLRSRMTADRPFEKVEAMRLEAEGKFREQEDKLKARLADLEKRLSTLQSPENMDSDENGNMLMTPRQQEELNRFRDEMLSTRKELREVQRALHEDIEKLSRKVKLINIALVPLLILLLALFLPARLGMRRHG